MRYSRGPSPLESLNALSSSSSLTICSLFFPGFPDTSVFCFLLDTADGSENTATSGAEAVAFDGCDDSVCAASVDLRFLDFVVVVGGGDDSGSPLSWSAAGTALLFFFLLLLTIAAVSLEVETFTGSAAVEADGLAKMSSMSAFASTVFCGTAAGLAVEALDFLAILDVFQRRDERAVTDSRTGGIDE